MRFAAFWIRRASLAVMFSSEAPGPTRTVELAAALPAVFAAAPNHASEAELTRDAAPGPAGEPRVPVATVSGDDNGSGVA